jgi:hypothetical protein
MNMNMSTEEKAIRAKVGVRTRDPRHGPGSGRTRTDDDVRVMQRCYSSVGLRRGNRAVYGSRPRFRAQLITPSRRRVRLSAS